MKVIYFSHHVYLSPHHIESLVKETDTKAGGVCVLAMMKSNGETTEYPKENPTEYRIVASGGPKISGNGIGFDILLSGAGDVLPPVEFISFNQLSKHDNVLAVHQVVVVPESVRNRSIIASQLDSDSD